jgi:hypothetical protein
MDEIFYPRGLFVLEEVVDGWYASMKKLEYRQEQESGSEIVIALRFVRYFD